MSIRLALDVRLDGHREPIGLLEARDDDAVQFQYSQTALDGGQGISLSLPLSDAPFGDSVTRAFFDNLLPENDQMQRTIDREGLDRSDVVGILAHVGGDCAGAISCMPQGALPLKTPGVLAEDYRPLDPNELALIVQRLADRKPLPFDIVDASPVAGVQRKIALTELPGGGLGVPKEGRRVPTTHILKVPRREHGAEALREDAACRLAQAAGFEASNSRYIQVGGLSALLVERYDRVHIEGVIYRLHQEDFAQALGLPASLKYERRGTAERKFDTAGVAGILNRLSNPAQAREMFVLATLFNLAIGNTDNHAKNHGVLYLPDDRLILTPLYDLVPIRLSNDYTHDLAYALGGATRFDDMTAAQMMAFLAAFGLDGARARRFIEGPVKDMLAAIERQSEVLLQLRERNFYDLIGRELERLSDLLDLQIVLRERDYFEPQAGGWGLAS